MAANLDRVYDKLDQHSGLIQENTRLSLATDQTQKEVVLPALDEVVSQVKSLAEDARDRDVAIRTIRSLWAIFMALVAGYIAVREAGWLK